MVQAMFSSIQKHFLRCKMLVGECPKPYDLHFSMQAAHPGGTLFTR